MNSWKKEVHIMNMSLTLIGVRLFIIIFDESQFLCNTPRKLLPGEKKNDFHYKQMLGQLTHLMKEEMERKNTHKKTPS